MPIYEYECPKCKKIMEMFAKVDEPNPLCVCSDGDPVLMKRILSTTGGFQLKGSGWARDGYSKKKG